MAKWSNRGVLSQRETEILMLIGQGISEKDIAERLQISLGTVKSHIKGIRKRGGLHEHYGTLPSIIQSIFSEEVPK